MKSRYRLPYTRTFSRVLRAVRDKVRLQTALTTWSLFQDNPLLRLGAIGQWDEMGASWASVVRPTSSEWRMYYSGKDRNGRLRVGLALSDDGLHWEKYENNPVLDIGDAGDWDARYVYCPIVWVEGDRWSMIFTGSDSADHYQIGLAQSDDGIVWSKSERNPIFCDPDPLYKNAFGNSETEAWGLLRQDGKYFLLYNSVTVKPREVRVAESADLLCWKRASSTPVLPSDGDPSDPGYMKYCAWPLAFGKQYLIFAATSNENYTRSAIGLWRVSNLLSGEEPVFLGYVVRASKGWYKKEVDTPILVYDEENAYLYFAGRSETGRWTEGLAFGKADVAAK
jgi:predicted GH43/DUF377 family glycosyl hydrolase